MAVHRVEDWTAVASSHLFLLIHIEAVCSFDSPVRGGGTSTVHSSFFLSYFASAPPSAHSATGGYRRSSCGLPLFIAVILDEYGRIGVRRWGFHLHALHQCHMLDHGKPTAVQTVFNRVADSAEAGQGRREEREEIRLFGGFDDETISKIQHLHYFRPMLADFNMA